MTTPWIEFRTGMAAPWEGFQYLRRQPKLWRYAVVPVLLNVLITGAVLLMLLAVAVGFGIYLHPLFPTGWVGILWEVLSAIGLLLLALGLALAVWTLLEGVLCGHYHARLAREVEIQLGAPPESLREITFKDQLTDACGDAFALVAINGGFLVLHIVPVIGSAAAIAGSLYFDWRLFGQECFDYPLALRGKTQREKKEFTRRHRGETLELGAVVLLANLVPVVGSVAVTTAVVGAVLLHRRLDQPA